MTSRRCRKSACGERGADAGQPPGARLRHAVGIEELGAGGSRLGVGPHRLEQRRRASGQHLRVLVEEQAELALSVLHQQRVVGRLALAPLGDDQAEVVADVALALRQLGDEVDRSVVGGVVEDEDLVLDAGRVIGRDRPQAGGEMLAPVGVDDAVGELHRDNRRP